MSQLLVAVKSSEAEMENGVHQTIRGMSWYHGMRSTAIIRFFIGLQTDGQEGRVRIDSRKSHILKSDEVALDVPDGPNGLVHKVRGIAQYAVSKNISHMLMVNTSSIVIPQKVQSAHYAVADYSGIFDGGWGNVGPREVSGQMVENCYSWASGRAGYFLSSRAARELGDASIRTSQYVVGSNDDFWVGQVLGPVCASGDLFSIQLSEPVCEMME